MITIENIYNIVASIGAKYHLKIIVYFIFWMLARTALPFIIRRSFNKINFKHQKTYYEFVKSIVRAIINTVFIVMALHELGVQISGIFALVGAAGISISLIFKSDIESFVAGAAIILSNRVVIGDKIKVDGVSGTVEIINIMYCVLKAEGKKIIIPNSMLTQKIVIKER